MDRVQINVRIEPALADRLDIKRIELKEKLGKIPTRSEIVRLALDEYLSSKERKQ